MKKINRLFKILTDSNYRFESLGTRGYLNRMPDKEYLSCMFKAKVGYPLNLDNPKTFNEKLQWIKLYDRKPAYTIMVDKYAVKGYVASIIGEQYIIPTLGAWEHFEDIDFDALPDQFVLKCTHDSGGLVICKDKSKLDIKKAREKINKSLHRNYYYMFREWPYKDVKPRIIAEKYMEDASTSELRDCKFFCFNGEVRCLYVSDSIHHKLQFYDDEYNILDIERYDYAQFETLPSKPKNFEQMKKLAHCLSKDIPHVRVDFYEINGQIFFGELTFFTGSGFIPFKDRKWDELLGSWVHLPL